MDILCKGGRIDGNCSPAAANTEGAARGEAGAAAGGGEAGKAKKASEHSHLVQCGPLFPGRVGGWDASAFSLVYGTPETCWGSGMGETGIQPRGLSLGPGRNAFPRPPSFPNSSPD